MVVTVELVCTIRPPVLKLLMRLYGKYSQRFAHVINRCYDQLTSFTACASFVEEKCGYVFAFFQTSGTLCPQHNSTSSLLTFYVPVAFLSITLTEVSTSSFRVYTRNFSMHFQIR